ncbi:MAG: HAMP domain-containing histidine kinase [Oscillospiraceae bacterium]|nr:HAMP domain-containing histidine kinase [Oscillospiraceae bacterium]
MRETDDCTGILINSSDFISNVAHELRTPVAVLRGSLEALCDGVIYEKEQVEQYHRQMLSESIYLQRLVTDLLELSRLNSSSFEIIREPVNLSDVVCDVCRSISRIAVQKNIAIIRESDNSVYIVNGDYARLRQMLIVILDNAVKFTPEGGTVTVNQHKDSGKYIITVSDTGCGIAEDEIENIFCRFHRLMSDANRNGSGLGLPIAREIALRHDASIDVKSRLGKGTSFIFTFSSEMSREDIL